MHFVWSCKGDYSYQQNMLDFWGTTEDVTEVIWRLVWIWNYVSLNTCKYVKMTTIGWITWHALPKTKRKVLLIAGGTTLTTLVWWHTHYEDHVALPQHSASYLLWRWNSTCHVHKSGLHGLSPINKRPIPPPKEIAATQWLQHHLYGFMMNSMGHTNHKCI